MSISMQSIQKKRRKKNPYTLCWCCQQKHKNEKQITDRQFVLTWANKRKEKLTISHDHYHYHHR